jgi:GNAT superfamily N-acetyltransferase
MDAPEFESYLAELKNKYWTFFHLDRSEDLSRRARLIDLFEHTFDREIFSEVWYLENLVVHKDYQRRGIGAYLVKWGLAQAEAERVPCGVESSFAGRRLYEKMEFQQVSDMRYGDKEKETMAVMVWEPSGMKGHWFEKAKAATDIAFDGKRSGRT